jgi:hypothetical protein
MVCGSIDQVANSATPVAATFGDSVDLNFPLCPIQPGVRDLGSHLLASSPSVTTLHRCNPRSYHDSLTMRANHDRGTGMQAHSRPSPLSADYGNVHVGNLKYDDRDAGVRVCGKIGEHTDGDEGVCGSDVYKVSRR